MSSVKEWLFIAPEHQIAKLVDFLEVQIGLLPCVPAAKARPAVLHMLASPYLNPSLQWLSITSTTF